MIAGLISWPGFEHDVERCLGGAAHAGEAAGRERLAKACLSGLGAERELAALGERVGGAEHRREGVVGATSFSAATLTELVLAHGFVNPSS